jgi:hypothetical protein
MSNSSFRRNTCRLCNATDVELVVPVAATPPGDRYVSSEYLDEHQKTYPLDLYLCHSCGLLQLLDVVDPEVLYGKYIYTTSISLGLVEHFRRYADAVVERMKPAAGAIAIDIGSNDGTLLKHFQERGMRVLGVEPAHHIAQKATESGVETLPTFFSAELAQQIKNERGSTSVIVTIEEHTLMWGLGSTVAEFVADANFTPAKRFKPIGIPDVFPEQYGSSESLMARYDITADKLVAVERREPLQAVGA